MLTNLVDGFPKFDPTAFEDVENPNGLQVMWNLQRMLMSACEVEALTPDVAFWVTRQALINEMGEALENFADLTKPWKRNVNIDLDYVKKELVDVWFFLMQNMILVGMTPDELEIMYREKNTLNFKRIMEKMRSTEEMVA